MMVYVMMNVVVEFSWKVLVLGILPLPVFFMKVIGGWLLLYVIMYYGILVVVNSNGN